MPTPGGDAALPRQREESNEMSPRSLEIRCPACQTVFTSQDAELIAWQRFDPDQQPLIPFVCESCGEVSLINWRRGTIGHLGKPELRLLQEKLGPAAWKDFSDRRDMILVSLKRARTAESN